MRGSTIPKPKRFRCEANVWFQWSLCQPAMSMKTGILRAILHSLNPPHGDLNSLKATEASTSLAPCADFSLSGLE